MTRSPVLIDQDRAGIAWRACATPREAFGVLQMLDPSFYGQLPHDAELVGGVAIALIQGLRHLLPELVKPPRPLRIVFAGAAAAELFADRSLATLLASLFGTPNVDLQYVGPGVEQALDDVAGHTRPDLVQRAYPVMLAHFVQLGRPRPDLLVLIHPGLEYNHDTWLPDSGLLDYVRHGIPVLAASYRPGEALDDCRLLGLWGFQTSAVFDNVLAPEVKQSDRGRGAEYIGRSLYLVEGVDMDRYRVPDRAALERERERFASPMLSMPATFIEDVCERARVIRGGPFAQRQAMRVAFERFRQYDRHMASYQRRILDWAAGMRETVDYYGGEYLALALRAGREDLALEYLRHHPSCLTARTGYGTTPLMAAAGAGATEFLRALVAAGAALEVVDDYGHTALEHAVLAGEDGAAIALLDAGADPGDHGGQSAGVRLLLTESTHRDRLTRALEHHPRMIG